MLSAQSRSFEPTQIDEVASDIREIAEAFAAEAPGPDMLQFAEVLEIYALLLKWVGGVRQGGERPEKHLNAAKLRADEYLQDTVGKDWVGFETACQAVKAITSPTDIAAAREAILQTALSFPLYAPSERMSSYRPTDGSEVEALNIAFIRFAINGEPASSIDTLAPNTAYDLEIDLRISRWPDRAELLVLVPISVDLADGHFELPRFSFPRPQAVGPVHVKEKGRLILKLPLSFGARPYEFKYAASFEPNASEQAVSVIGHRTLRLEGVDLKSHPISGYREVDEKLISLRRDLRTNRVPDEDLQPLFVLLAALGNASGQALSDNLFPKPLAEEAFQRKLTEILRAHPTIGSKLEQHPAVGAGITDLSFEQIRLELKVEAKTKVDAKLIETYADQTVQYVVATGKRIGILCILDGSPKSGPPSPTASQIQLLRRQVEDGEIFLIVVVIQGNLATPSSLSR
ncbi:hypothetical protein [Asticcacaulis sp. W401b]|uniref:hypothetical protein n=1 Tax=Asticcacaulis sp. W401b TaxID=3388666 RepID=UPI003970951E